MANLIKGKQIADAPDGISTSKVNANAITPAKADLSVVWGFTSATPPTATATPVGNTDLCNKAYVDSIAAGLSWKQPARAASSANVAALTGTPVVDGVATASGDRVLLTAQTTGSQNGLWVVQPGAWIRPTDFSSGSTTQALAAAVFIEEGTNNANTAWVQTVEPATIDTTALTFVQFSGAGTYTAGNGLQLVGNAFSVLPQNASIVAAPGGTSVGFSAANPTSNNPTQAASAGTSVTPSRDDHQHATPTAAQSVTIKSDASAPTAGTAASLLRTDAQLTAATANTVQVESVADQGTSTSLSRADHVHASPSMMFDANQHGVNPTATNGNYSSAGISVIHAVAYNLTDSGTNIGTYVQVKVNGVQYTCGDGVKTKDCYFSNDSGVTALQFKDMDNSGPQELFWNGVISGFDLAASDKIDFDYLYFNGA